MTVIKFGAPGRDPAYQCPPCTGDCRQGRNCNAENPMPAEACTDIGADATIYPTARTGLMLLLLPWLLVAVCWAIVVTFAN